VLPNFSVVFKWTTMVCAEFTAQVAQERALGLPVAPHMDNLTSLTAIAKLQGGFVSFVVAPFWNAVAAALPELGDAPVNMRRNVDLWKQVEEGKLTEAEVMAGAVDSVSAAIMAGHGHAPSAPGSPPRDGAASTGAAASTPAAGDGR
jgi:hypothetical protein